MRDFNIPRKKSASSILRTELTSNKTQCMFEHKTEPILPITRFFKRSLKHLLIAFLILGICLLVGVAGFHFFAHAGWLDAFHNACMLLSGMGPVITIKDTDPGGKWFSSFYALFSGVIFITNIGVILAPAAHRIFHILHLEEN